MEKEIDSELVEELTKSIKATRCWYPVLCAEDGEIIDGFHRVETGLDVPKMIMKGIVNERDKIIGKIVTNWVRKDKSNEWKSKMLSKLSTMGMSIKEIADATGLSERTIYLHLPPEQKERPGIGGPKPTIPPQSEELRQQIMHPCRCPIFVAYSTNSEGKCVRFDICIFRRDPRCPAKGSTVKLQFITRGPIPVQCAGCTLKTIDPQKHTDGKFYCPLCYDKLTKPKPTAEEKPALPPPPTIPKPSVETPQKPKTEPYVYKPTDTWAHRKAQMSPPVSKFEEKVAIGLEESGLPLGEAQGLITLPYPIPDRLWQLPKGCMALFLDGPVHKGREDKDRALREALQVLGVRVVEIKYEHDSDQALHEAVETIKANLEEMGWSPTS